MKFFLKYKKHIILVFSFVSLIMIGLVINIVNAKEQKIPDEIINEENKIKVCILGEVKYPNTYMIDSNSTVKDLIILASGLTNEAEVAYININRTLKDNEVIYITKKLTSDIERINVNNASLEQLQKLKGIGEAKAYNIMMYRVINGPYKSFDDLLNVDGINEKIISDNINEICLS